LNTDTHLNGDLIFSKTEAGREEIAQRSAGLSMKQSSVLIMLDGTRKLGALTAQMAQEELLAIVTYLFKQGLIQCPEYSPPLIDTSVVHDVEVLTKIKNYMKQTARKHLGLLSANLVTRIDRARDASEVVTVVGHWHMAVRESKDGRHFISDYMNKISAALKGDQAVICML
jgi:hypothetical protein